MKKLIPILAFLAIVGFISRAEALTEDTCGMSVTVVVGVSLSVTDEPLAFGNVNATESGVSTSGCTVENDGSALNDYSLKITGTPAGWAVEETAGSVDWDEFRLLALFTSTSGPADTAFSTSDDIVRASTQDPSSADAFAITAEGVSVKGYDCTATSLRKLWFRFDAPLGTTITTQQWITVTVYASS